MNAENFAVPLKQELFYTLLSDYIQLDLSFQSFSYSVSSFNAQINWPGRFVFVAMFCRASTAVRVLAAERWINRKTKNGKEGGGKS